MSIDSNDELNFDDDESSNDLKNSIADFDADSIQNKNSKHNTKRSYEVQKKIELLKEERRLRKLIGDDWD